MTSWTDRTSVSIATANGIELSATKWATCWGWHIDPTPGADVPRNQPLLAKGTAATRDGAKTAAEIAFAGLGS